MTNTAGGNSPISPEAAYRALDGHPGWVVERHRLYRDYRFESFTSAIKFVNRVAELAERLGHHPNIRLHEWCFVQLELYSHQYGTISTLDVEFALALDSRIERPECEP